MLKLLRNRFNLLIVLAFLAACKPTANITSVDTNVISIDTVSTLKEDTSALRLIKPFKEKMLMQMKEVLGYTDGAMIKDNPEGILNNFVADLVLTKAKDYYKPVDSIKVDFCLLNYGGLRASLPKGAVTLEDVYELMPFENNLVVITLGGQKTKQVFDYIAKQGGMPVSGISMGIKDTLPVFVTVNGVAFDSTKNYKIITSDYLANGGDKMTFFKTPLKREDLGIKLRDAIISYIKEENSKGITLTSKLDKRVHYEK